MRIDTTNLAEVHVTPDAAVQADLLATVESVKPDRSGEDLLFQVLLDWGLEAGLPIEHGSIDGREVFAIADDALIACFADEVTDAVVKGIANRHPIRAVFLDTGFATDAARINAEQIFREVSPETEVRTI